MNEKPKMVSNFNISQVRNSKIERSNTVDDTKKRNHKLEKVERLNVTPASGLKKIKRIQCTDIQKKRLFMKGKEKSMIDNIAESNISISKKYVNDISCFTKPLKKIFELKNPNLALKKKYKKVKGKKAVVKKRVSSKSKNKNLDKSDLKMNIISNISKLEFISSKNNNNVSCKMKPQNQKSKPNAIKYCNQIEDIIKFKQNMSDLYKRKFSGVATKQCAHKLNLKEQNIKQEQELKPAIIDYMKICERLRKPENIQKKKSTPY